MRSDVGLYICFFGQSGLGIRPSVFAAVLRRSLISRFVANEQLQLLFTVNCTCELASWQDLLWKRRDAACPGLPLQKGSPLAVTLESISQVLSYRGNLPFREKNH